MLAIPEAQIIIPLSKPFIGKEEKNYVVNALDSQWISNGPYVTQLEDTAKDLVGSNFALAVSNGTAALHLALLALNIKPEDEIIIPAFTFAGAANISILMGAKVVSVDIDPETWSLDLSALKKAITKKTKAIFAVHPYGGMMDMPPLMSLAQEYNLPVIEDAAEAFGSTYNKKYAGTFGTIGTYSFHASKIITTGEGGIIVTDDRNLYEKMKTIREHGMRTRNTYWHECPGHNFRLTNIQAAMGCAQLDKLDIIYKERCRVWQTYYNALKEENFFTPQKFISGVIPLPWMFSGTFTFTPNDIKLNREKRDSIITFLKKKGIESRPGFFPLHELPYLRKSVKRAIVAEEVSSKVIVLPIYPTLTEENISYITENLKEALRNNKK